MAGVGGGNGTWAQKVFFLKIKNYLYLKVLCFLEAIFVDLDLREVVPDGSTWDNNVTAMKDFRKQPWTMLLLTVDV